MTDTISCHCDTCSAGCKSGAPGWFAPGEAEEAWEKESVGSADIEFWIFFEEYLSADYWHKDGPRQRGDPLVLAPALEHEDRRGEIVVGRRVAGRCIFYDEQKGCTIHTHKPAECRFWDHRKTPEQLETFCRELLERWKPYQGQIVGLLSGKG